DGQVHGGVAQGIGAALLEEIVYDDQGQLLSGTLMDYVVPSACEIPMMEVHHVETPSPVTLGGFRGMGEGGTIGAPAAIAHAVAYQGDVADYAAVGRMIDRIVADLGRLDVVVNNAGYVEAKLFLETTPEEWRRQVDVDLYGVFNICHAAAPKLAAQKGGRIISIVGDSARVGQARLGVSAGARGAVLSITRTLAKELGR